MEKVKYGDNLKAVLEKKKIRVAELSRITKVPATTIYSTIQRNTAMSYEYAVPIAKYLKMPIKKLTNHIPEEDPDVVTFTVSRDSIDNETEQIIKDLLIEIEHTSKDAQKKRLSAYCQMFKRLSQEE